MRHIVSAIAIAIGVCCIALSSAAGAQEGTVSGAAGGAVTGAVVGGPVGAAVGGVAGAIIGTVVAPPREVRSYVVEARRPSIVYDRRVIVGERVPESVEIYSVPDSEYGYTVINERRYIVDGDRQVVEMVDE